MTPTRILNAIRTANCGSRELLDAVDATNMADWQGGKKHLVVEGDRLLAERTREGESPEEIEEEAEEAWRAVVPGGGCRRGGKEQPWRGPRENKMEEAA